MKVVRAEGRLRSDVTRWERTQAQQSVIYHLSEPGSVGAIGFRCKAPVLVLQLHPPTSLSLLRKTTTVFQYAGLVPYANLWDFLAY